MITVGITAFREKNLLNEAWQSVLAQTSQDWKAVIVLDGGADDYTEMVFDNIEDTRLTKIKLDKNLGPYPCRNLAIDNCQTAIYFFLDADDLLAPQAIEKALATFQSSAIDYLCVGVQLFNSSRILKNTIPKPVTAEQLVSSFDYPGLLVAFKKQVWAEVGGFAEVFSRGRADFDFLLSLLESSYKPGFLDEILYYYRQKDTWSVSKSYDTKLGYIHEELVTRHPLTFENKQRKDKFLEHGYRISAEACFQKSDYQQSLLFTKKAFGIDQSYKRYWYYFPFYLLPYMTPNQVVKLRSIRSMLIKLKTLISLPLVRTQSHV